MFSMRKLLIPVLLSAFVGTIGAYDVELDGIYYTIRGKSASVTHCGGFAMPEPNSYSGNVVVPERFSYNGRTYVVGAIGEDAFACCDELISVQLPSTVTAISSCAFLGCPKLQQVTLPSNYLALSSCGFTGCTSLQQVFLPRKAELVDSLALYCCASLNSLILPHRIRTICGGALQHLSAISDLYCYASEPPTAEKGSFTLADQQHCTLHVPKETLHLYQEAPIWREFYEIVPLNDAEYLEQGYRRGDINDDGKVDDEDLALLRLIIVSLPDDSAVRWAADINEDGKINATDYVLFAKRLAQ